MWQKCKEETNSDLSGDYSKATHDKVLHQVSGDAVIPGNNLSKMVQQDGEGYPRLSVIHSVPSLPYGEV